VEGVGIAQVSAGIPAETTATYHSNHRGAEIEIVATGEARATVPVWLELEGGHRATLEVPFPTVSTRFIDPSGHVLPLGTEVSVDALPGLRVEVLAPRAGAGGHVTACLYGDRRDLADDAIHLEGIHACRRDIARLVQDDVGRHVLPLHEVHDAVRRLLSMSTDLDAHVELRVELDGAAPTAGQGLKVRRYDAWFDKTISDGVLSVTIAAAPASRLGPTGADSLRVEAFPIRAPDADRVELTRTAEGWTLELAGKAPGPWFLLGSEGVYVRFRPLLVTLPGDEDEAPTSLRGAMSIASKPDRRRALDVMIKTLSQDASHPDWDLLWHQLGQLESLPPTTYDAVDRLIRNQDASALTLLAAPTTMVGTLYARLEELPFMWALLPVRSWLRAVERLSQRYEQRSDALAELDGGWRAVFHEKIAERFQLLVQRAAWFLNVWDAISILVPGFPVPEHRMVQHVRAGGALHGLVGVERNAMRQRHAEEVYPRAPLLADELERVPRMYVDQLGYRAAFRCEHEAEALNAPLIVAAASVLGTELRRPALFDLARMRAFDPYGFDEVHQCVMAQILGQRIVQKGERFDDAS